MWLNYTIINDEFVLRVICYYESQIGIVISCNVLHEEGPVEAILALIPAIENIAVELARVVVGLVVT